MERLEWERLAELIERCLESGKKADGTALTDDELRAMAKIAAGDS